MSDLCMFLLPFQRTESNSVSLVKLLDTSCKHYTLSPFCFHEKYYISKRLYNIFQHDTIVEQNKPRDVIGLSRQLAMQANQLASNGNYIEAAKLFTQAISLFGNDCRYFGNRSYCYDRLGRFSE